MRLLGDRHLGFVARESVRSANWVALARMRRVYPDWLQKAKRYFTSAGDYPYRCEVRTQRGLIAPTLYSQHDMVTVNEVFCREDYPCGSDIKVAVDLGSNIGISALFFLTRSEHSRVWLYEPVPRNVDRLRKNLAGFKGRWRVEQTAVADHDGRARFSIEPSGRYGSLESAGPEAIEVNVRNAAAVLREVLEKEGRIDVLKIDTEGSERRILDAIPLDLLSEVRLVYVEDVNGDIVPPPRFTATRRCSVLRLAGPHSERL